MGAVSDADFPGSKMAVVAAVGSVMWEVLQREG
jgi:hypothetical protein